MSALASKSRPSFETDWPCECRWKRPSGRHAADNPASSKKKIVNHRVLLKAKHCPRVPSTSLTNQLGLRQYKVINSGVTSSSAAGSKIG